MLIPLDLHQLTSVHGPARVSIFLPTVHGAEGVAENRARLEVLLRLVDDRLRSDGLVDEFDAVVSAVRRSVDEWWRWRNPSDGLAIFADPGHVRYFRVRLPLPELPGRSAPPAARSTAALLRPLDRRRGCQAVHGHRSRLDEMDLDNAFLPDTDADKFSDRTGSMVDDRQERVVRLFRQVDSAVRETLADECAPLVLVGEPAQQALYRQVNSYPNLLADGVPGCPRDMSLDVVHSWARGIAEPELHADERAAAGRYRELIGTGRTSTRPEEVLVAAQHGRVDTLFLSTETWRPQVSGGPSLIHCDPPLSIGEKLAAAALATLHSGGTVLTVPAASMPEVATGGAAVFRYERSRQLPVLDRPVIPDGSCRAGLTEPLRRGSPGTCAASGAAPACRHRVPRGTGTPGTTSSWESPRAEPQVWRYRTNGRIRSDPCPSARAPARCR
jgi:hypothetical protein